MANYAILKTALAQVIKPNGNEEITGQILQDTLIAVINALGLGYQFMGVAQPDTDPGTPDQRVMYLATEAGTYSNFGSPAPVLDGNSVYIFTYASSWTATELDIATKSNLSAYLAIADLASETGQSTTTTMTQKAITTALIALAEDIETAVEELTQAMHEHVAKLPELVAGSSAGVLGRTVDAAFLFRRTAGAAKIGRGAAALNAIYGRTLAWNQRANCSNVSATNATASNKTTNGFDGTAEAGSAEKLFLLGPLFVNATHIYYVRFDYTSNINFSIQSIDSDSLPSASVLTRCSKIGAIFSAAYSSVYWYNYSTTSVAWDLKVRNMVCFDLTQMFGAGNEPTTVEEIEALYNGAYPYNPGALIHNDAAAMETVGFNQWDEECTFGSAAFASKNDIPVVPNTDYCISNRRGAGHGYPDIKFLDSGGNTISTIFATDVLTYGKQIITTPANCRYIRFLGWSISAYGYSSYQHDICINLSDPAKNGTYEPYWERVVTLGLSTLTGKLNGQGASVVVFTDGMNGVGTDRDVIRADGKTAYKTMARVDLGNLAWSPTSVDNIFYANLPLKKIVPNAWKVPALCSRYQESPSGNSTNTPDKCFSFGWETTLIFVHDSAYTDAATFKAAMNGVYLDYPLATPETYVLDEPLQMSYQVENGGTEQAIAPEGATLPSAPFMAQIQYPLDVIALQGDSLADMLDAMVAAGVITAYTMTYNVAAQKYEFTINGVSRNLPENNRKGGGDDEPNGDESSDKPGEEPTDPGNDEPGEPGNGEPQEEHEEEAVMSGGDKEPTYEDNGSGNVQPVK